MITASAVTSFATGPRSRLAAPSSCSTNSSAFFSASSLIASGAATSPVSGSSLVVPFTLSSATLSA